MFDKWVIDLGSPIIANINASTTTIEMPSNAVEITATYKNIPDIVPIDSAYYSFTDSDFSQGIADLFGENDLTNFGLKFNDNLKAVAAKVIE